MTIHKDFRKSVWPFCVSMIILVSLGIWAGWHKGKPDEANQLSTIGNNLPYGHCNVTLAGTFCSKAGDAGGSWRLVEKVAHPHAHQFPQTLEARQSSFVLVASDVVDHPLHDCASCHEEGSVLSATHPPTSGMKMDDCKTCHIPHEGLSLVGKLSLSHTHILSGVGCASCHGDTNPPEDPGTATCLACHGPLETLAAITSDVDPTNPHSTPHGPPFAECSLCHLQHEPPQNFCSSCHDFEFKLP